MKVIHVIDSGGLYGAEWMLINLCLAQIKLGICIEVLSLGLPNQEKKPLEDKLEELDIKFTPWRMKAIPDFFEGKKILDFCVREKFDIIHSHSYKTNVILGFFPKKIRTLPIVTTIHGYTKHPIVSKMTVNQFADRISHFFISSIVLVSNAMRDQIFSRLLDNKIEVIPNGIPEHLDPDKSGVPPIFKSNDFTICSLGRLSNEKNFQLIIRSMPSVLKKIPNAKLLIFGEGPERHNLENIISSLNLNDCVHLPGYTNQPDKIFKSCDLFINSSYTEGMPVSILEALREGCNIVASDIKPNREILAFAGLSDHLAKPNIEDFSKTIVRASENPTFLGRSRSVTLKNIFSENFTSEKCATRYIDLYYRTISNTN